MNYFLGNQTGNATNLLSKIHRNCHISNLVSSTILVQLDLNQISKSQNIRETLYFLIRNAPCTNLPIRRLAATSITFAITAIIIRSPSTTSNHRLVAGAHTQALGSTSGGLTEVDLLGSTGIYWDRSTGNHHRWQCTESVLQTPTKITL